jgi:hypothetical protein
MYKVFILSDNKGRDQISCVISWTSGCLEGENK